MLPIITKELQPLFDSLFPVRSERGTSISVRDTQNQAGRIFSSQKDDEKISVKIAVPGFKEDELSLRFVDNFLILQAQTSHNDESERDRVFWSSSLERRIYVKDKVDASAITADLNDGVLSVSLPLIEAVPDEGVIQIQTGKQEKTIDSPPESQSDEDSHSE